MRWLLAVFFALATLAVGTPAMACTIVAQRCDPDGCNGPLYRQAQRDRDQRAAIEYGRAIAQAMNARVDLPTLDRGYDLATVLLPNVRLPVAFDEADNCSGGLRGQDEDSGGSLSIADAEAAIRVERRLPATAPVDAELLTAYDARQSACNLAVRRDLATYLNGALPPDQLRELWAFLLPRAGATIPHVASEPVTGARLLFYGADGSLVIPGGDAGRTNPISARRERAWHYLEHHRNGRAIMSAMNQFVASRLSGSRAATTICPGVGQ